MQFRVMVSLIVAVIAVTALLTGQASAEGQVLRVAFDKAMPPFSSVDENGDVSGFNADLLRAIAKQYSLQLEYVPLEWEDAVAYLQQGKVDVIMGMKYTSRFDREFDFSESFFTMSDVLLVPKEDKEIFTLHELKDKVVAVQRGNTGIDLLESVRRVKMLVSFNQPDALANLIIGRADAYIGNRWTAEYILRKENKWDDYDMRLGLINPTDYAFAVREGNYELLQTLNEGLNQLYRDGTYMRMYSSYFEPFSPHVTGWWRKLVIGLFAAMGLVVIVLVTIFYWNKKLQSEVKKQTAALANSLAFQRKVLDNTESAILSLDVNGHITLVNQVARRLLQLNDDVLGRSLTGLLPQLPIEAALTAEQPQQYDGEFHWDHGMTRIFHFYIAPFFNAQDEHAGWIISLQDRTEQKRLQTTLIAQEKMRALGQLVAGIAHELRNPLTAIKAFIDLLPKKLDDQRFRQELLHYVPEELERMNRIVEDLLDYSRSRPLQSQAIALHELVQSVIGLFAKRMQHEQIDITVHVPPDLSIWADRQRVKQVLLNLVLNAVEAMAKSQEKRLTIKAYQDKGDVVLSICDTGEGMDESVLTHLFQPFYTTKTQGIGLGLYLSEKMMREQGGRIEVDSVRGVGSTFILRFSQIQKEESYAEPVAVGR